MSRHAPRTNSHYAKAVAAIPGYLGAIALRDKAQAEKRNVLFPVVAWPDPPANIDADLTAYLAAYVAAFDEEQTRTKTVEALDAVVGACERQMRSVIGNLDVLLTSLAADLDDLMTRLGDVATRLDGATTPIEAIDNGTADAWKELPALRREYDSIRGAQRLVNLDDPAMMNDRSAHIDDDLASDVILANLDELLPAWREPDTRFAVQGTPLDRRPWPADELEQLLWLSRSRARVWIPTASQLSALHRERRDRIDPPLDGEPGNLMSRSIGTGRPTTVARKPSTVIR